jgi:hypothetical protein
LDLSRRREGQQFGFDAETEVAEVRYGRIGLVQYAVVERVPSMLAWEVEATFFSPCFDEALIPV